MSINSVSVRIDTADSTEAELVSKVFRHQAVLIRAERMRARKPVAVFSKSSRPSPGRVFQHPGRNSRRLNKC